MVKRIKKYKISLRPSAVLRNLKKRTSLEGTEEEIEKNINLEIGRVQKSFYTFSSYETFSQNELPESLKDLWSKGPESAVSLSLIASTIGNSLENESKIFQNSNNLAQRALIESIGVEACDQSFLFGAKLLQDESKLEGCECSSPLPVESLYLKECLTCLQVQETEISLNSEGILTPLYSRLGFCFWTPLKKR